MAPGMRSDLVLFCDHAFDYGAPLRCAVDGAFVQVIAGDHEGRFGAVHCQLV